MKIIKYIALLTTFSMANVVNAEQLPLMPMSQNYNITDFGDQSIEFKTLSKSLTFQILGSTDNMNLRHQDNKFINLQETTNDCIVDSSEEASINNKFTIIQCNNLDLGAYKLEFTNSNSEVRISILENNIRYAVTPERMSLLRPNKLISQGIALYSGNLPLLNASVNFKVLNENNQIVFEDDMLDNGLLADGTSSDGLYSVFYTPSQEGSFKALFTIKSDNTEYTVENYFDVESKLASLTDKYTISGIDENGDAEFESYDINFDYINNNPSIAYTAAIVIEDANGNSIQSFKKNNPGSNKITVNISANDLLTLKNRPWTLKTIFISIGGSQYVDALHNLGPIDIDTSKAQRKNIEFLGVVGHKGIDDDNDGKFESLAVDVKFATRYPGQYSLTGTLRNSENQMISDASIIDVQLNNSTDNIFTLYFSGSDILNSGYIDDLNLWDLSLVPDFTAPVYLTVYIPENLASLPGYSCNDFAVCDLSIEDQIRHEANLLCDKKKTAILEKLDKIQGKNKKNSKPQQQQLEALRHRVSVMQKSKACSNENVKPDFLIPREHPIKKEKKA
ncbi:MAG: choice-of-anchor X domain-containing protein [Pseudomonadota bacterium]|nr:choice-of-anchor X domain-containing protein [Pseudomonadota bacterium]